MLKKYKIVIIELEWFIDVSKGHIWLTLLFLADDRNQISSLVHAVFPGIHPAFIVFPKNYFVALCEMLRQKISVEKD